MNNTATIHENGVTKHIYYSTTVVTINTDGNITLNSGGHYSSSTKKRINSFQDVAYISQKNYIWYATTKAGTFEFYDGITFDQKGNEVKK